MTRARALLAALLLAAACQRPATYTVSERVTEPRRPAATAAPATATPPQAEAAATAPKPLRVLVFGDFGDPTDQQRAVAAAMVTEHRARPFDLGFSLGDNVYPCGPDPAVPGAEACRFEPSGNALAAGSAPVADPRIAERYERPLLPLAEGPYAVPIHVALGNHDVASHLSCREGGLSGKALARRRACIEVAHRSPLWNMPARHYVVDRGPARFVVLDSNLLIGDYGGFTIDAEVAFVRDAVRGADGRRVFVVAHHPAATAATHRDDFVPAYLDRLGRVLAAGGGAVSGWFAGHDHQLEHLRAPGGLDVIVSGNGARARPDERFDRTVPEGAELVFASTSWGFAVLEVTPAGWSVRFQDENGRSLHCCEAVQSGRCEPVACPADTAHPGSGRSDRSP